MKRLCTGTVTAGLPMSDARNSPRTRRALYGHCLALLRGSGLDPDHAVQEATWLMEFGLGVSQVELQIERGQTVTAEQWDRISTLCARRATREPLQYVLGDQDFCGLTFRVQPGVLIPRPETEVLADAVVTHVAPEKAPVIVDIGTGSGCVAITVASRLLNAVVYATDLSRQALTLARYNADRLVGRGRIRFLNGDLCRPLREVRLEDQVSVLVSNPPYLTDAEMSRLQPEMAFEPREALAGGPDGLAFYRRLIFEALPFLAPGGLLAMEVGAGQAPVVRTMLRSTRAYDRPCSLRDASGIERVVSAQKRRHAK
jgi:release factor glutamine methyltransferase